MPKNTKRKVVVVTPFSFRESLRHARREPTIPADRLSKAGHSRSGKDLLDYLATGGFPEAQGLDLRNRVERLLITLDRPAAGDIPSAIELMTAAQRLLGTAQG